MTAAGRCRFRKTLFHYVPFDGLRILLDDTLHVSDETPVHFDSMDTLYAAFKENLRTAMEQIYHNTVVRFTGKEPGAIWEWNAAEDIPCSAVSLLEEGVSNRAVPISTAARPIRLFRRISAARPTLETAYMQ